MKSGFVKLILIVVGLSIFFTYIGVTFLPQSESLPPKVIEIRAGISGEELLEIGEDILFGKGQCMVCHPFKPEAGMRAPSIATIGRDLIEHAREKGITPQEYVFQALVDPGSYVPEGYAPIMPPSQKLLAEGELIAVTAFLQSKGGSVTASYPDSLPILRRFLATAGKEKETPSAIAKGEIREGISQEELIMAGKTLFFDKGACIECHLEKPEEGMDSPPLLGLGSKVEKHARERETAPEAFLFESMVNPEAYVAEGFDSIMPPSQDFLSESELVAVGAFVQSQGRRVTLTYPESLKILKKELEKSGGQ
jgi:mono/diheme cytochrome c family protein